MSLIRLNAKWLFKLQGQCGFNVKKTLTNFKMIMNNTQCILQETVT